MTKERDDTVDTEGEIEAPQTPEGTDGEQDDVTTQVRQETSDVLSSLDRTYVLKMPPSELLENAKNANNEVVALMKEVAELTGQLQNEQEESKKAEINAKIEELNQRIELKTAEARAFNDQIKELGRKEEEKLRIIKEFSSDSGIDLIKGGTIIYWDIYSEDDSVVSGIKANSNGFATRKEGELKIKEITVDELGENRMEFKITYVDGGSEKSQKIQDFIREMKLKDGYKKMDKTQFIAENAKEVLSDKLEVGYTFVWKKAKEINSNGETIYENIEFQITEAGDDYVILDKELEYMPLGKILLAILEMHKKEIRKS